jgi:altronate dehydratase small subunit
MAGPAHAAAWDALVIHRDDDVGVALRDLAAGAAARARQGDGVLSVTLRDAIPLGHKFALRPIASGAVVRKYGEAIGEASVAIDAGGHVHVHNLRSRRARAAP